MGVLHLTSRIRLQNKDVTGHQILERYKVNFTFWGLMLNQCNAISVHYKHKLMVNKVMLSLFLGQYHFHYLTKLYFEF